MEAVIGRSISTEISSHIRSLIIVYFLHIFDNHWFVLSVTFSNDPTAGVVSDGETATCNSIEEYIEKRQRTDALETLQLIIRMIGKVILLVHLFDC